MNIGMESKPGNAINSARLDFRTLLKQFVISAVLVNWLAACASVSGINGENGGIVGGIKPPVAAEPFPSSSPHNPEAKSHSFAKANEALNAEPSVPAKSTVYYPFDVSAVQDAGKPIVLAYAKYLGDHPEQTLRVEGNTDDRGSRDYNLALGQRRADGVKQMLVLAGAKSSQIDAVSFGEEMPKMTGHDEASQAQNRRSDIVLLAQAKKAKAVPRVIKMFRDCPDCPEMVVIPPGSFEMGSNDGEADEKPVHRVTIIRAFAMGRTEVTQGQWRNVMGNNPSEFTGCGDNCPVEQVSWNDAQKFVQKLGTITGRKYRLPTESEWEYACRADGANEYCGSDNVVSVAWYGAHAYPGGDSDKTTNPVAGKKANAFGLYDMSGNVWEWVEDSYHVNYSNAPADGSAWSGDGAKRVLRGGSWDYYPQYVRATVRGWDVPSARTSFYGIRVARTLP